MTDSRFKSYLEESELENICLEDSQKTKLLDGETLVNEASNVIMYSPLTDKMKSVRGVLTVTTFKLSYATANVDDNNDNESSQHNILLGLNEVCLSSIDTIYQVGDRSKKKLIPSTNISTKVKELYIICKNMRSFHFSFKYSEKDSGKNIANALLVHAYPKRHALLFAYEFKEPYYRQIQKEVRMFRKADDWKREMSRTMCENWRLSDVNINFTISPKLPEYIVVPTSVTNDVLSRAVEHFQNRCCPLWVWGYDGAALVRMADLLPTITDRTQENILLENIRKSHVNRLKPHIVDLTKECPSAKDVQHSYLKFRDLCVPDSVRLFKVQDFKFYALLDSTKWLQHVSTCLTKANEAASKIYNEKATVVLQEGFGQDMNCIVSSLIQLIIDPYWRSIAGFQSLIQKEWVVLGHPFASRLGHVLDQDLEASPIFLLYLDCVWQLLQQYPTAFQFSETYLTTLWDSAHLSIFETFLFNSERERHLAEKGEIRLISRSVWDWSEQFSEKDISLFCNPLFDDSIKSRLSPNTTISSLDLWSQCYFRWLPDLEIRNGGRPQIEIINKFVVADIHTLYQKLSGNVNGNNTSMMMNNDTKDDRLQLLKRINSFFPFSCNHFNAHGLLPVNNHLLSNEALDSQSILNLND